MAEREDARRVAETLLRSAGRAVTLRIAQAQAGPSMEMVLKLCVLKTTGEASAELTVAASAVGAVAGLPAELFSISSRVVADDIVWRVVSYAPVQCGETVVAWRVQVAR